LRPTVTIDHGPIVLDGLTVDPSAHRVVVAGSEVQLRPREFELLLLLVRDRGRVVTRERILSNLWGPTWDRSTHKTLEMHVVGLRRKLGDGPHGGGWITTVRSVGYRFEAA
jgi:DNA-binding response OmpR family regulator